MLNSGYKIMDYTKIQLSKDDLARIPRHRFGFMVASCLAANDQNFFLKNFLVHLLVDEKNETVMLMSHTNHSIAQRHLISKTYEFMALFDKFNQSVIDLDDKKMRPFVKYATKIVTAYRKQKPWALIKLIRNKMTHHYDMEHLDPKETVSEFAQGHLFSAHMHSVNGNSFYDFAEEISYLSNLYHDEHDGVTMNEILFWLQDSTKVLIKLHQQFMTLLFREHFPDKLHRKVKAFVPDKYIWNEGTEPDLFYVRSKAFARS